MNDVYHTADVVTEVIQVCNDGLLISECNATAAMTCDAVVITFHSITLCRTVTQLNESGMVRDYVISVTWP